MRNREDCKMANAGSLTSVWKGILSVQIEKHRKEVCLLL